MPRHAASAASRAPPEIADARILSRAGLQKWWIGTIHVERVDADWPAVGSRMAWRAGGRSAFEAEVVENALPSRLVMRVRTPTGEGTISHTFDRTPDGGTRYEKVVESDPKGIGARIFDLMLTSFVRREVRRAAADAAAHAM